MDARKSSIAIGLIVVATLLVIAVGLMPGARMLSFDAVLRALFQPDGKIETILVWTLRLPRSLAAATAGAGLAVSGYLLQALTRNPLADPGITGVTAGASRRSSPASSSSLPSRGSPTRSSGSPAGWRRRR